MTKSTDHEVSYRLAKWVVRNMQEAGLLRQSEVKAVWADLLSCFPPPIACVEIVGCKIDGENNPRLLSLKTICGVCGNRFVRRKWHCRDWMWGCKERYITGHSCTNVHLYDRAFEDLIKRIMLIMISRNPDIIETCKRLVDRYVKNRCRKEKAIQYLENHAQSNPENVILGDEIVFILDCLILFPGNKTTAFIINAKNVSCKFPHYTPRYGRQSKARGTINSMIRQAAT